MRQLIRMSTGIAIYRLLVYSAHMTTPYQKYLIEAERRRKRIVELFNRGYTQTEIARKMQVSRQRIHQVIVSFDK